VDGPIEQPGSSVVVDTLVEFPVAAKTAPEMNNASKLIPNFIFPPFFGTTPFR